VTGRARDRKVLIAITQAKLDSMEPTEVSRIVNVPGVDFLVIERDTSVDPPIFDAVREQYTLQTGSILIQSPFDTNCYYLDETALHDIVIQKTLHVAQVCTLLGATSVSVSQVSAELSERSRSASANLGMEGLAAKLKGESSRVRELRRQITLSEESVGGEPDIEGATSYVQEMRLGNDPVLTSLIRARGTRSNPLKSRKLTIDATREARSSIELAASLDVESQLDIGSGLGRLVRDFDQVTVEYEIRF